MASNPYKDCLCTQLENTPFENFPNNLYVPGVKYKSMLPSGCVTRPLYTLSFKTPMRACLVLPAMKACLVLPVA